MKLYVALTAFYLFNFVFNLLHFFNLHVRIWVLKLLCHYILNLFLDFQLLINSEIPLLQLPDSILWILKQIYFNMYFIALLKLYNVFVHLLNLIIFVYIILSKISNFNCNILQNVISLIYLLIQAIKLFNLNVSQFINFIKFINNNLWVIYKWIIVTILNL